MGKGKVYINIESKIMKKIGNKIEKIRKTRCKELHDLPQEYSMREYRVRENELNSIIGRIQDALSEDSGVDNGN